MTLKCNMVLVCLQANETLALARATENKHDKNQLLEESLQVDSVVLCCCCKSLLCPFQLFSQVSHRIDLSSVCTQYGDGNACDFILWHLYLSLSSFSWLSCGCGGLESVCS